MTRKELIAKLAEVMEEHGDVCYFCGQQDQDFPPTPTHKIQRLIEAWDRTNDPR